MSDHDRSRNGRAPRRKDPIRVGILLDGLLVESWVAAVLRDIQSDSCAELVQLAQLPKSVASPEISLKGLLFRLYQRWDSSRIRLSHDPFARVDLGGELAKIPKVELASLEPADVKRVRDAKPDVLLYFGATPLKGPILKAARYGVWSYHHGGNDRPQDQAAYFWGLYDRNPVTGVVLRTLTEPNEPGQVLYRSFTGGEPGMSVRRNAFFAYWKSSTFVIRRLRQLHEHGWEWMQRELPMPAEDPAVQRCEGGIPTNAQMLRFLAVSLGQKLQNKRQRRGMIEQWFVAYKRLSDPQYRVLACQPGHFFADPFVVSRNGREYIFFEDYIYSEDRGRISFVEVRPDLSTTEPRVALERPFHLSYPFVFEHDGEMHMIPETGENGTVELYRATAFPERWEQVAVLKQGLRAYDVTLLVRDGVYWFFATLVEREGSSLDELFLFYSDSLTGEWTAHPKNPIVSDVRCARPAGRIYEKNGTLIRPGQDGSHSYGSAVQLSEIVVLSKTDYKERPLRRIAPDWAPGLTGTHTFNHSETLEVIDGKMLHPEIQS